jgi:hypothetical protein
VLEEKRRIDRERKQQKAREKSQQPRSNPSTSTKCMRQHRESNRMYHPDKAEAAKEKNLQWKFHPVMSN